MAAPEELSGSGPTQLRSRGWSNWRMQDPAIRKATGEASRSQPEGLSRVCLQPTVPHSSHPKEPRKPRQTSPAPCSTVC